MHRSDIYGSFYDVDLGIGLLAVGDTTRTNATTAMAETGVQRPESFVCRFSMRLENIGRRGLSQKKEDLFFVLFNSGRIQSSRYVRGGCKQDATRRRAD